MFGVPALAWKTSTTNWFANLPDISSADDRGADLLSRRPDKCSHERGEFDDGLRTDEFRRRRNR
jgi:hypothetical protein